MSQGVSLGDNVHEDSNVFVFVFKYVFEVAPISLKLAHNHRNGFSIQHAKLQAHTYNGSTYRGKYTKKTRKTGYRPKSSLINLEDRQKKQNTP